MNKHHCETLLLPIQAELVGIQKCVQKAEKNAALVETFNASGKGDYFCRLLKGINVIKI